MRIDKVLPVVADSKARSQATRLLVTAAAGAILGFGAENLHLAAGVWALPRGAGLPWWIVAVYFFGLLGAGFAFAGIERRAGAQLVVSRRRLVAEMGLFASLFLAPVLLHTHELLLTAVVTGYLALRLALFREPGDLCVVMLVVVIDVLVEGALVSGSFYRYPRAEWMALPLWLAPLWGGLGLGLRRFFRVAQGEAQ